MMKRLALGLTVLFAAAAMLAAEAPLSNSDVVKLVKAGISPGTIILKIERSKAHFDTSADALVALKNDGVPEDVLRAMVLRASAAVSEESAPPVATETAARTAGEPGRAPTPVQPQAVATSTPFKTKRYLDVTVHSTRHAGCPNGELAITSKGIETSRCRGVDFKLKWPEIVSVCYEYGTNGMMVVKSATTSHRVSTVTPAEMKDVAASIRRAWPQIEERTLSRCD